MYTSHSHKNQSLKHRHNMAPRGKIKFTFEGKVRENSQDVKQSNVH